MTQRALGASRHGFVDACFIHVGLVATRAPAEAAIPADRCPDRVVAGALRPPHSRNAPLGDMTQKDGPGQFRPRNVFPSLPSKPPEGPQRTQYP